ncbi:MAG: hypothetical protein JW395_1628 [Nitrospira sp.]|nr:hypothetical protein [Nitrospira sp.]
MPSEASQEKHGLFPAHGCEELKTFSAYRGDGQPWSQTVLCKKTEAKKAMCKLTAPRKQNRTCQIGL